MWSKGAVVILKHGDEAMANSMIKGVDAGMALQRVNSREVETLRRDNFFLKRRSKKSTDAMIADARKNYGKNYILPKWAEKAIGWSVLIAYPLFLLLDRIGDEFNALVAEMNTGKHVARKKNKPYYRKEGRRRSTR